MKKLAYFITTLLACGGIAFTVAVIPAFATNALGGQRMLNAANKMENHAQNQSSNSANKSANQLQNIKTKADTFIMNRLDSLNTLLNRIQNDTRLTTDEKNSLVSEVQQDVSGLTSLKAKIDADTDVTTARTDEKSIITGYYIYAVFEPKIRLLVTLNNLQTTTSYVQALIPQLQNLINTLKAQGKDTSQIQTLLNDVSSQVQTINTTLATDITTVQNISTTTKRNPTDFSKIRQDISQIVKTSFAKIRSDFGQMRPLFKQIISTISISPSAATSITPTVTETPSISPAPTQ